MLFTIFIIFISLIHNRIHLDLEQEHVMLCVNDIMADCYRSHRYKIKLKYDELGLDEEGRKYPPMNISLDVWEYLCDIWCKEEYQVQILIYIYHILFLEKCHFRSLFLEMVRTK